MEAKDTVIDCTKDCPDAGTANCNECDYGTAYEEGCKVQAEISFKAGIKEVVEWIRKANNSGNFYYSFDQVSLEAKLKEWGL